MNTDRYLLEVFFTTRGLKGADTLKQTFKTLNSAISMANGLKDDTVKSITITDKVKNLICYSIV